MSRAPQEASARQALDGHHPVTEEEVSLLVKKTGKEVSESESASDAAERASGSESAEQASVSWVKGPWIYARGRAALFEAMRENIAPSVLSEMPQGWDIDHNTKGEEDENGYAIHMSRPLTGFRWKLSEYFDAKGIRQQVVELTPQFASKYTGQRWVWSHNKNASIGIMRLQRPRYTDALRPDHDPEHRPPAAERLCALMSLVMARTLEVDEETKSKLGATVCSELSAAVVKPNGTTVKLEDLRHLLSNTQCQEANAINALSLSSPSVSDDEPGLAGAETGTTTRQLALKGDLLPDIRELYKVTMGYDLAHFDEEYCTCGECELFKSAETDGEEGVEAQALLIARGTIPKFSGLNLVITYATDNFEALQTSSEETESAVQDVRLFAAAEP